MKASFLFKVSSFLLLFFFFIPVAFAEEIPFASGDIFFGTNGGKLYHYSSSGSLRALLTVNDPASIVTPLCFDHQKNLRVAQSSNNTIATFTHNGILVASSWGGPYNGLPTRCVTDTSGNFYIYTSEIFGTTNQIRKFTPSGILVDSYAPAYDTTNTGTVFSKGLYAMDLAADNCTMLYTAVQSLSKTTGEIKRFNVCTDSQLPDLTSSLPKPACTDLRIRPNGEVLTTCGTDIYRLDPAGSILATYTPKDVSLLPKEQVTYSLDLDPDRKTFWAGGNVSGNVYHIAFSDGVGKDQKVFNLPLADPVWNTLVGLVVNQEPPLSTLTPTPPLPSSAPEPFLDLPWEYKKEAKTFTDAALNPSSWFDHAYPLQNVRCCVETVLSFIGRETTDYYRSHSGYDYPRPLGSDVLAASSGFAIFIPETDSEGGGNMIKIDHGNGYQTWYEHLGLTNLIVSKKNTKVFVTKGQKIGEVGMSGNSNGPHLHFSVFYDTNGNGTFSDDYPYGLVDPLGWEGNTTDPWTVYGDEARHGAVSTNLFLAREKPVEKLIPFTGASMSLGDERVAIVVPEDAIDEAIKLEYKNAPFASFVTQGQSFASIAPSFFLSAFTTAGQSLTQFKKPITILYHYSGINYFSIDEASLVLYFFNEQANAWEALPSHVDTTKKTVTAQTTHFSQFALMGKRKDTTAPKTTLRVQGTKGSSDWYRSSVTISLSAKDNTSGLGIQDILYRIDTDDWQRYTKPITLSQEGTHTLSYLSIDKAGNKESIQIKTFTIDTIPPEIHIFYDISQFDVKITARDNKQVDFVEEKKLSLADSRIVAYDMAGNSITLITKKLKAGKQVTFSANTLQYNNGFIRKLDSNLFFTMVTTGANSRIKTLEQYISFLADKKIYTQYSAALDKTATYSKSVGESYRKEEKAGLVLLRLETQKGRLTYVY